MVGLHLARHHGLQLRHQHRRGDDADRSWCADTPHVPSLPRTTISKRSDAARQAPCTKPKRADRHVRDDCGTPSAQIDLRAVHHAVGDHRLHAADAFLGRLEHQLHRAGKLRRQLLQHRRDAEQRGGVDVVAARMHQPRLRAGERQAGLLLDRQRVHVGADRQHRARPAALDQSDHAGPPDARLVADAQPRQLARHHAGGAHLLEAEFRMRVDVAADLDQRWLDALGGVADRGGRIVGKGHGAPPYDAAGIMLGAAGYDKLQPPHPATWSAAAPRRRPR